MTFKDARKIVEETAMELCAGLILSTAGIFLAFILEIIFSDTEHVYLILTIALLILFLRFSAKSLLNMSLLVLRS